MVHRTFIALPILLSLFTGSVCAEEKIAWHDANGIGVEGKAWDDTEGFFDRLPARVKEKVREPVWNLSLDSAWASRPIPSRSASGTR
jgi:hypothetical protein